MPTKIVGILTFISRISTSFERSNAVIAVLWSPTGTGLTSWLLFVMFNCVFVTLPCGFLGQEWYLIVSISDLIS